jgi:P2 family phage contractile tail tube protein
MAGKLPQVFKGMNLFLRGNDWQAAITKFQPSIPKPITKEINSPGMLGAMDINTSKWSKPEPTITIQGYHAELLGMVGDPESADEPVTILGVVGDSSDVTVEFEITGLWKDTEAAEWADDANAENTFKIAAEVYSLKIEGKEVLYLDFPRRIARVNGKDVSADINKRLRIS